MVVLLLVEAAPVDIDWLAPLTWMRRTSIGEIDIAPTIFLSPIIVAKSLTNTSSSAPAYALSPAGRTPSS